MTYICQLCDQVFEELPDEIYQFRHSNGPGPALYIIDRRAHELVQADRSRKQEVANFAKEQA